MTQQGTCHLSVFELKSDELKRLRAVIGLFELVSTGEEETRKPLQAVNDLGFKLSVETGALYMISSLNWRYGDSF
jgi:hypothetical protein